MAGQLYPNLLLAVPLAPLAGAAIAGLFGTKFFGNKIGRTASHSVTILGVTIALLISLFCLQQLLGGAEPYNATVYTWMTIGKLKLEVGFLVDNLTVMMMCVVSFVSLMVHIYTIGYMKDDPGYNRFFAYISLFTFSMLMLVMMLVEIGGMIAARGCRDSWRPGDVQQYPVVRRRAHLGLRA